MAGRKSAMAAGSGFGSPGAQIGRVSAGGKLPRTRHLKAGCPDIYLLSRPQAPRFNLSNTTVPGKVCTASSFQVVLET
ncbi:MAG: hypothetical protein KGI33_11520 [Thaumarchaeota archaeon]|nr:hypothetical protein [Nitrososphaerota archaeon]